MNWEYYNCEAILWYERFEVMWSYLLFSLSNDFIKRRKGEEDKIVLEK